MVIEYPPQTSLPLIAPGWKCLLVGKRFESCSQIITQNVQHIIKQCVWSDMLPVCEHLQVGLCKSPFIQVANLVVTNSQILRFLCSLLRSSVYCDFLAMWRQKKELCRRLLPPYHSSCFHHRVQWKSLLQLAFRASWSKHLLTQSSFQEARKALWRAELISQFFCYSNSSKNNTCPSGKLKTEFSSLIEKSTTPGLSDTTFFACCFKYSIIIIVC